MLNGAPGEPGPHGPQGIPGEVGLKGERVCYKILSVMLL